MSSMTLTRFGIVRAALALLWWGQARCQVTWGPGPLHLSDTDDLSNQQRLYDLLRRAFLMDSEHKLLPAIWAEIADFRQRVEGRPSLALGVAMAKYHFSWYKEGSEAVMDVEHVEDAANLMYASIQFSGCDRPDLSPDAFFQRMCSARWPYVVMLYSELGREFAARYLTEQAANILEKALAAFDQMKRLPYYAPLVHWYSPYDMNFNEEWFPGVVPSGPVWDKAGVPLARFLEESAGVLAGELLPLAEAGLFEEERARSSRSEGQDSAPLGGWQAVELMSAEPGAADPWATAACRRAPQACALLRGRPELQGCQRAGVTLVRLRAGGALKPQFGAAPKLLCHLALRADIGARMSVGNQTLTWRTGEALVVDDTYIRQEWHAGVKGEQYTLQVAFCHPCEASQRQLYGGSVLCPAPQAATAAAPQAAVQVAGGPAEQGETLVAVPFAAAALWAATLPELALCNAGISEQCPPDSQHGGPNPLSAVNTWNYALNNLKAAVKHSGVQADPSLLNVILQVQAAIQEFLRMPALEQFGPIVATALQVFEATAAWLQQQPPAQLRLPVAGGGPAAGRMPSDGQTPVGLVTLPLANGVQMPALGFGTWKLEGQACYDAVRWALELGIRHLDTAEAYGNEAEIGRAVADSRVPRQELFIATKATSVALGMEAPQNLHGVFAAQLQALQTDYVDVYMMHAAGVKGEQLRAVWQGMEALHDMGRVRALGVSNFGIEELEELWSFARIKPVYLQNILKVYKPGEQIYSGSPVSVMAWARSHGATLVGYSVINSWPHLLPPLQDPHVLAVAKVHGRTASQVLHRWALQHGAAVIPKASSRERIRENAALFDFALSPAEMALLDGLASLSESTHDELRPAWGADAFGLHRQAAPHGESGGAAGFQELMRGRQCSPDLPDARAEAFSLGGGSHQLSRCQAACAAQPSCRFVTFYHTTGFCHMFRACPEQSEASDGAAIYARL